MARVRLDLNNPEFQKSWFALEPADATRVLTTLRKISRMDWDQLYRDPGIRWESIASRKAEAGDRLYSLRVSQRIRAVAVRDGDFLRLQGVHADHDSAYQ